MYSDHKHSVLSETDNGSVMRCTCCRHFQLSYGNIILKLEYESFISFMECINKVDLDKPNESRSMLPNGKHFLIKLPNNIAFGFTREEIMELRELLDYSQATLKVNELIKSEL